MRRSPLVLAVAAALLGAPTTALAAHNELSVTDQLNSRRYVSAGDRAYIMGFQDGSFPAQGWHITGEMGGVWSQPLKLVDGVWFSVDGQWLPKAWRFTSGWGYTRLTYPRVAGLQVSRTDVVPDGRRGALFGLRLRNPASSRRTVDVAVDAHSEVMGQYPWSSTKPDAGQYNLDDTGAFQDGALVFRDVGTPPVANAEPHDWAALVGANRRAVSGVTGPGHRGPVATPQLCTSDDQFWCDDGPFGKGTGGQLRYRVTLPARGARTLWVGVAGSDQGVVPGRRELGRLLRDPAREVARKQASRRRWGAYTKLSLPADRRLALGVDWAKQNLLDLTQRATNLRIRDVNEGKNYDAPLGTIGRARWIGAGYPDYPWIFATDAEYTAFAAVSVGQFGAIADHARALRNVSLTLNGSTGKVAHEIVGNGAVYYGDLMQPGNTDETAKFPSLVALVWRWTGDNRFRNDLYPFTVRNMRYVVEQLDKDGDGWPSGLGNVERAGMGDEKLDNAVYTIRGLLDLADMAQSKNDTATRDWARGHALDLRNRFEGTWWSAAEQQYADSLLPGNAQSVQRHWIAQTPMEAELTDRGTAFPGLASFDHGLAAITRRHDSCFSGERPYNLGMFHTGCGGGPEGKGERTIFGLNTAIQAVAEGNYGQLGARQQKRYTDAETEPMFGEPYTGGDPRYAQHKPGTPDEQPGAQPEIFPSPDFDDKTNRDANVERCTRCRSMVMQAWNAYGTTWPVVHQQLGVRPDMGRRTLTVVPQVPPYQPFVKGRNIRLGKGAIKVVKAIHQGNRYRTIVDAGRAGVRRLWIGATLPRGAAPQRVWFDGRRVRPTVRQTNRGTEVTALTRRAGQHELVVVG